MPSPKSLTTAAVILIVLIFTRSHRMPTVEQDELIRSAVTEGIRSYANRGGSNPYLTLEQKAPIAVEIVDLRVVRTSLTSLVARFLGDEAAGYRAYARYAAGGAEGCMSLQIEWVPNLQKWTAGRGRRDSDLCEPWW
jgi:hypothetical protein